MKKLFFIISLLLISNTALAISLGDLKKTLEDATEEIKKEIETPKEQNKEEQKPKKTEDQSSTKQKTENTDSQKKNDIKSEFKIISSNGRDYYEKEYFDEIISDSLLEIAYCEPSESYICLPMRQKIANILFKTPNDLTWFMFTGYGNLTGGRNIASYPPEPFMGPSAGTVFNTNPKNFIQYKDPKFRIDHNQTLCTQPKSGGSILKAEDCVEGVSVLTIDLSFIKGKGTNQFSFPTGLGSNSLNMTPDEKKFIMRDRMSFVIQHVEKNFAKNETLGLSIETIGLVKRVVKGDDILFEPDQVSQTPGGGSKNYIDYYPVPYGYIVNSYKFDEELENKINLATYSIQHKGEEIIPGTDIKTVLNNWNTLSELSSGYLACVKDNSQNFDNLTKCSEKYEVETIKVIDWRTNNYYQRSTTDSMFNLTADYLYPDKIDKSTGEKLDMKSYMNKRSELNKNGIRPISEILECINSKIKEMEFDSSIDLNSYVDQNCSSKVTSHSNYISNIVSNLQ